MLTPKTGKEYVLLFIRSLAPKQLLKVACAICPQVVVIYDSTSRGASCVVKVKNLHSLIWRPVNTYRAVVDLLKMRSVWIIVVAVVALAPLSALASYTPYTWTAQTNIGSRDWGQVSISATGTTMVAASATGVATSTNSGATWAMDASAGSSNHRGLLVSSGGTKFVTSVYNSYIYTSINSGDSWTAQTTSGTRYWIGMAGSSNLTTLLAPAYNDYVYMSTTSGATWSSIPSLGSNYWDATPSCSSTCGVMVVPLYGNGVYMSTTTGATWMKTSLPSYGWFTSSVSSDGTHILVGGSQLAYISTNTGASWTNITPSGMGLANVGAVAISPDGTHLAVAGTNPGYIFTSIDGGSTWTEQAALGSRDWGYLAFSSNGSQLVADDTSGYLYTGVPQTAPAVSIISPAASTATSSTMTIAASATGTFGATIVGVSFYLDGVKEGSTITTAPYTISYNTAATSSSSHTVFAVAKDSSGNYATSSPVSFFVNNIAPSFSSASSSPQVGGATFSWNTASAATTKLAFGLLPSAYSTSTKETNTTTLVTSHGITLSDLPSCVTYHYVEVGRNNANVYATSTDATFTTGGCTGNASITTSTTFTQTTTTGGATLTLGALSLTVPTAFTATSTAAYFQINALNQSSFAASAGAPSGLTEVGTNVYHLSALMSATTTLSTFKKPLTVTFAYTSSDLTNINTSSLAIYRYDVSTWTKLSGCTINTGADTVTCTTSNFSDFALFGTKETSSSSSSSGSTVSAGAILAGYTTPNPLPYGLGGPTQNTSTTTSTVVAPSNQVTGLSETQISAILNVLASFHLSSSAIARVSAALNGTPAAATSRVPKFTRNLRFGSTGYEVTQLQQYLNAHGYVVSTSGPGSLGQETTTFGLLTKAALIRFQKNAHISPSGGFFGPITRAYIAKLAQ